MFLVLFFLDTMEVLINGSDLVDKCLPPRCLFCFSALETTKSRMQRCLVNMEDDPKLPTRFLYSLSDGYGGHYRGEAIFPQSLVIDKILNLTKTFVPSQGQQY